MSIPELRASADGIYYAYWSEARRSKRKSMRTADATAAQAAFGRWLLSRGTMAPANNTAYTMAECWAVYWSRHVEVEVVATDTLAFAWAALKPHFGDLPAGRFDQASVNAYVKARGRTVRGSTMRRELLSLAAALRFCALPAQGMLPPGSVPSVKLPPDSPPRERWLTDDEAQRLLAAAETLRRGERLSRAERFLWLALYTAGRKTAISELTWDRVDFETRVIHLDIPGRKQTKKRRASVPISARLLPVLQRAHDERVGALVLGTTNDIWRDVQLAAIEAGLGGVKPEPGKMPKATGVSPHVLRHTAATHMARRGVPLWKIAKILGDTLATVERVYAKHCPDDLREAVDTISAGQAEQPRAVAE